MKPNVQLQVLK